MMIHNKFRIIVCIAVDLVAKRVTSHMISKGSTQELECATYSTTLYHPLNQERCQD